MLPYYYPIINLVKRVRVHSTFFFHTPDGTYSLRDCTIRLCNGRRKEWKKVTEIFCSWVNRFPIERTTFDYTFSILKYGNYMSNESQEKISFMNNNKRTNKVLTSLLKLTGTHGTPVWIKYWISFSLRKNWHKLAESRTQIKTNDLQIVQDARSHNQYTFLFTIKSRTSPPNNCHGQICRHNFFLFISRLKRGDSIYGKIYDFSPFFVSVLCLLLFFQS